MGSIEHSAELPQPRKVVPPIYLAAALASMLALHYWAPLAAWVPAAGRWVGVGLAVASLTLVISSAGLFRRAGTPAFPFKRSTALVTGGAYRFTRNPMYLGMAGALVGVAIYLGSASPWLPIPIFVLLIDRRFIRPEERFLEILFGEEYRAYRSRVRRWI